MPYSQTLEATGTGPITWSVASGSLPDGLTLSPEGVISGTPTTVETSNFTVSATNSVRSTTRSLYISVRTASMTTYPNITTDSLAGGIVGVPYSQTLTATGTTPITCSLTGILPDGLTLSPTGVISGTPTTAGTFSFYINAVNGTSFTGSSFSITVAAAPVAPTITTASLVGGTVGLSYRQTLAATGDTPITWSVTPGSLPDGLTLSSTGTISGTPTAAGVFTFTVEATNATSSDTKSPSITIAAAPVPPTIMTTSLAGGVVGTPYSQTLSATGDTPIAWSVSSGKIGRASCRERV
jgi:hypothetical protein